MQAKGGFRVDRRVLAEPARWMLLLMLFLLAIHDNGFGGQKSVSAEGASPMRPLTPRLVALGVPDVAAAAEWYEKELGFKLRDQKNFPKQGVYISLLEHDGFFLEIYKRQMMHSHAAIRAAIPQIERWDDVEGFQKLAFVVDDAGAVAARLKKDGVQFAMEMQQATDDMFGKSFIVLDNNGNWVQFCELKPHPQNH